ncbi:hypothetical protein NDI85_00735 [Halomicroarcula sp. S1AR25-4]|uniref:hypothetical protein n=1 Tax=Haloarcula sp. S1AR25-4 TaxID=2950538 RepID=UPI00287485AF|nr:hypothetical protein [Halomicroarcula sp. S1AR25-4]MDS0276329.1 hypothetical protein [Halomicroarcula sp. S1AR25-4]
MNLDELQSVQSRERQTDQLQQLRATFYEEAGQFVNQLREERDRAADRADDPFDSPEVNRLTDDIKTAEQTVEAIYERRVGKIVKMASLAAADMPTEDDGLTQEERHLFETMVGAIKENRQHVLDVIAGEAPTGAVGDGESSTTQPPTDDAGTPTQDSAPAPPSDVAPDAPQRTADEPASSVDAADLMGGGADASSGTDAQSAKDGDTTDAPTPPPEEPDPQRPPDEAATAGGGDEPPATGDRDGGTDDVARKTVRITDDVGEIFGVDQREYDLSTDDVVTLPADNADPLVERDAAEPLE